MASRHSQVSLMLRKLLTLQKPHITASFNMYFVINKCVTPVNVSNFSRHLLQLCPKVVKHPVYIISFILYKSGTMLNSKLAPSVSALIQSSPL
jgi:hypothetical protein